MNIRRLTATAVLVIAAMGVGAGTSAAAPEPAAAPDAIGYQTKLVDKTVVTNLVGGVFEVSKDGKSVDIKDTATNKTAVSLPLTFNYDNITVPISSNIKDAGKTLELTPKAVPVSAQKFLVKPVASTKENEAAMSTFATQFGIATAVGGFLGTAVGGLIGGLVLGGATCAATLLVLCIPGIITGAGVGAIIGTIAIGGPALGIAAIDLVNTLLAPPGTSKYADQLPK